MWKLGRVAETAIALIEHFDGRFDDGLNYFGGDVAAATGKCFGLRDRIGDHVRLLDDLAIFLAVGLRNRDQDALETWTAILILRREIGSTVEGLAVWSEKSRKRPAALSGKGADCDLITAIDIGTLVAVYFHRDVIFVHDLC